MICIAATGRVGYHAALHASIRLIGRKMDQPQSADSTLGSLQARGSDAEPTGAILPVVSADDFGQRNLGKPVGAVIAAAKVLRILHASERPLNASEVARAASLHRGTAYNILRTLQAEGFVGYDEATRSYSVSLHILELAYGVLRRSGLMDLMRTACRFICRRCWAPRRYCCWTGSVSRFALTCMSPSGAHPSSRPAHRVSSWPLSEAAASRSSKRCSRKSRGTRSRLSLSSWSASGKRRNAASRSIRARCFRELRWCPCRFCPRHG